MKLHLIALLEASALALLIVAGTAAACLLIATLTHFLL